MKGRLRFMENNKKPIVNILWTGGWDSTYRIVELSRQNVTIQPIYCCDPGRKSTQKEMDTMEAIRNALINKEGTIATFLPIISVNIDSIPINEKITNAYKEICKKVKLGSQYEWLAGLSQIYPNLELGLEKPYGDDFSSGNVAISTFGKFKLENGIKVIDCDNSSEECKIIFSRFKFPIVDLTELEMAENIKKWGYEDIMKMIWFCHTPIKGKPCGVCRPCQQKMDNGMNFLINKKGQKRYKIYKFIKRCFGEKIGNKSTIILRKF